MKKALIICVVVIAGIGIAMLTGVCGGGAITFTMQLDGKPLPSSAAPDISVDGKPYLPGLTFSAGSHNLTVKLSNANPFNKRFWIFWGGRDIGILPLETIKGEMVVEVNPSPASVVLRQGTEKFAEGNSPATFKIPVGNYVVEAVRGEYREYKTVEVFENSKTNLNILLNLGIIDLSSSPGNAEFKLTGNEHNWQGELPTNIVDVPVGDYSLAVMRNGWELDSSVSVIRGGITTNKTKFPYGSIDVTSQPTGLVVSTNGIAIGKTPVTLSELRPATYRLTISDGENDLMADVNVGPRETAKHDFVFRYGTVQLMSSPSGAAVICKGKEIGKTPLTLNHIPVGETMLELQLQGYVFTNLLIQTLEGVTNLLSAKLISEQYLQAMSQARTAFSAAQFEQAHKYLVTALAIETNDTAAMELQDEVSKSIAKAEEAARAEQANAKAREMASLALLNFQQVISDCTDTRQVPNPVVMNDGYYDKNGKFIITGQHTEMHYTTESTFNDARFAAKYVGKTYKFDSSGWKIEKIENDGTIVFRTSGSRNSLQFGQDEIRATPSAANQDEFLSAKDRQQITIKAEIKSHDRGDFFSRVQQRIYLEDAELLDK